jgi:photosystem II stability/assembly factor-like uncharacterized protein
METSSAVGSMAGFVFIAATRSGLARIMQGGDTGWSVMPVLEGVDVRSLAVDPLHPGRVYAGSSDQGLFRSDDAGHTWGFAGLQGVTIRSVAVSSARNGMIVVGTKPPGLYLSLDGGTSWQELPAFRKRREWWWFTPAEPGAAYVQAVALSPTDPDVILAGIEFGGVLRSEDGGATWSNHRRGALRDCHTLQFHAHDGRWAYEGGGTGGGAAMSQDGGKTWLQPRRGLAVHYGWATAADVAHPEVWYVAVAANPFKAHGDGPAMACIYRAAAGASWERIAGPLDGMPYALITHAALPGYLIAGLSNGRIMRSANQGDTWEMLPIELGSLARNLVMVQRPM